jgi:hypothetical protein
MKIDTSNLNINSEKEQTCLSKHLLLDENKTSVFYFLVPTWQCGGDTL